MATFHYSEKKATSFKPEANKKTLIFSQGLTTSGRTKQLFLQALGALEKEGYDLNSVTYEYPSHDNRVMGSFEQDLVELSRVIGAVKENGVKESEIGLFGACYGAYLTTRYLAEATNFKGFAILAEPYTGPQDFGQAIMNIARGVEKLNIGYPVKHMGNYHFLNISALYRFIEPINLSNIHTPTLAFLTNFHPFFNSENQRNSLKKMGAEIVLLNFCRSRKDLEEKLVEIVPEKMKIFLDGLYRKKIESTIN